jgi:1,2-phenylacetyl-CoA epoxidase catalytic subunit
MWHERLRDDPRFRAAVNELWPFALGILAAEQREAFAARVGLAQADAVERGSHIEAWPSLWEEMTTVRRSAPADAQW